MIQILDRNSLRQILTLAANPNSEYYVASHYLLSRLIDCTKKITFDYNPNQCPLIFDSWSCFEATEPGGKALSSCPNFKDYNFHTSNYAEKICSDSGSWWRHPFSNKTWSNYTNCLDYEDQRFRNSMNIFMLAGLIISLVFLTISLFIFLISNSLHCGRVTMHMNLFISLIFNNISWLLWYKLVLFNTKVLSMNPFWCRILHVILTYFTLSTYFCMLCEGVYLQILLLNTFRVGRKHCFTLIAVAWSFPLPLIVPYSIYRHLYENDKCWMDLGFSSWFLGIPVAAIIIVNLVFLANVIRILRAKLSVSNSRRGSEIRNHMLYKQARATLFLVPILGVYFLLLPIRPESGSVLEYLYDFLSVVSSAFQGNTKTFAL